MRTQPFAGFTLIELLIVVAIIAILAAIAIPNLLEAQTRAKVAATKADQRSIATAIETYRVDWNHYPISDLGDYQANLNTTYPNYKYVRAYVALSTPINYLTSARIYDPFRPGGGETDPPPTLSIGSGDENSLTPLGLSDRYPRNVYVVVGVGPDFRIEAALSDDTALSAYPYGWGRPYDPTNGTSSRGDIFRCGPEGKVPRGWKVGPPPGGSIGDPVPLPVF